MYYRFCVTTFTLALLVLIELSNANQDWRGNPCERAGIPWRPFTTRVRLDPASHARLFTRTSGLSEFFCTREIIEVTQGTEDTIVVDFNVMLSEEEMQDRVQLVRQANDVALMIAGSDIGTEDSHECVVVFTQVALPRSVHHLTLDMQRADLLLTQLDTSFEELHLLSDTGSLAIYNSTISIRKTMKVELLTGIMQLKKSMIHGPLWLHIGRDTLSHPGSSEHDSL